MPGKAWGIMCYILPFSFHHFVHFAMVHFHGLHHFAVGRLVFDTFCDVSW